MEVTDGGQFSSALPQPGGGPHHQNVSSVQQELPAAISNPFGPPHERSEDAPSIDNYFYGR